MIAARAALVHQRSPPARQRGAGRGGAPHGSGRGRLRPESRAARAARDAPRGASRSCTRCLRALDADLAPRGSRLLVIEGDPAVELPRLAARLGARLVTHARNHEPAARAREARVGPGARARRCDGRVPPRRRSSSRPGAVPTGGGTPYQVYTAYARAWEALDVPPVAKTAARLGAGERARRHRARRPRAPPGHRRCRPRARTLPAPGSHAFLRDGIAPLSRDPRSARRSTRRRGSRRICAGERSPVPRRCGGHAPRCRATRRCARACASGRASSRGATSSRSCWRRTRGRARADAAASRALAARRSRDSAAGRRGRTGVPLVDAGMRELRATGFMHNRARMIVGVVPHQAPAARLAARRGALHGRAARRHSSSQNDGNWQWVAGTGADAQPFHRIFSPLRQGERFDPDGALREALGAGAREGPGEARPPAVGAAGRWSGA